MNAPSVELQGAIVAAVKGSASLIAQIGGIYDSIPEDPYGAAMAYVSLGPATVNPIYLDGVRAEQHVVQIDVWSKSVGSVECKQICHLLKRLLNETQLPLASNGFVLGQLDLERILPDPEDKISHGVLQFTFDLEDQT